MRWSAVIGISVALGAASAWAQTPSVASLSGDWSGELTPGGKSIRIVFRVTGTPPHGDELERALRDAGARKGAEVEVGDETLVLE